MLVVFNPRLKDRFQPGMREFPESLPSAGFSLLKGCTQSLDFLSFPHFIHNILEDAVQKKKKEDFMQIKE